jgi:hypothetical protein
VKLSFALGAALAFVLGCATTVPDIGPRYQPKNVHAAPVMPLAIRRVALLPITHSNTGVSLGSESFSSILEAELRKSGAFELINVSPQQLLQWTGKAAWHADEIFPTNFFSRIRDETGCDAVIFPNVTVFRAYPPLAIGLDVKLIECAKQDVLWAIDEVVDAGAAPVARLARDYGREHIHGAGEESAVLQSPSRFAQFASFTLVQTLPRR